MKKFLLQEILKKCHAQLPRHPQKDNFIHWTFLVKDGKIISCGVNRPIEPPRHYGYHREFETVKSVQGSTPHHIKSGLDAQDKPLIPKWHSELDAIKKCRGSLVDCVAVNVRLNKTGQERISMPCKTCRRLLYVTNIKKVFFTTEFGWGELCIK